MRGDRVVAVGSTAEVTALAGPATRRIALGGRVLVPGLNDANLPVRAGPGGVSLALGDGPFANPPPAVVLDSVAAAARRTPPGTWLTGAVGPTVLWDTLTRRAALFTVPPQALPGTASVLTLVGGRAVFDAGALTAAAPSAATGGPRAGAAPPHR